MSIWTSIQYWWNNQGEVDLWRANHDTLLNSFHEVIETREQIKFLLDSAPIMDAPMNDYEWRARLRASTIAFAYVNPKTVVSLIDTNKPIPPYLQIPGSPTKWILTSWMPEGRVIFSSHAMPGIDPK